MKETFSSNVKPYKSEKDYNRKAMHKASARPLKPEGFYEKAVIAQGLHLLPFRTEKLNLVTSMVLPTRESRKPPPYMRLGQL